jgi:thiol:disulfide interchange protein DsbC
MLKYLSKVAMVALLFGGSAATIAASASTATRDALTRQLAPKLERVLGPDVVEKVMPSRHAGLYEVLTPRGIVYTDKTASFVSFGPIVDTVNQVNLTERRMQDFSRFVFNDLPFKDAIKTVKGNGSRVMATFEDPNCGFCRKLMTEVEKLNDVTIYTFLVPILGPDSAVKSAAIWCAKDQSATWTGFMTGATALPATANGNCETPLERNTALQRKLRITGTPAILFPDNTRTPGFVTADVIEAKFKK